MRRKTTTASATQVRRSNNPLRVLTEDCAVSIDVGMAMTIYRRRSDGELIELASSGVSESANLSVLPTLQ